jgi:signal transduction histidine kinase
MLRLVPEWLSNLVLALAVATVSVGNAVHHSSPGLAVPAALVGSLALFKRRQYLVPVLAIETALAAIFVAYGDFWMLPGVAVAIGTVAATLPRERSLQLTGLSVAALAFAGIVGPHDEAQRLVPSVILVAVAWVIGDRKQAVDREREERSKRAVLAERARISRELHDVISHNVSVMVVQAAAGHDVFDTHPERARSALSAVEETGRRALAELRKLLDVGEDGDGTAPQPGLALVDELAERVRGAGLEVALTVEGTPRAVPEALDLSAYRIVQEALTNTLKHAHASRAEVRVRYEADALEVEVSDDGIGPGSSLGDGRGLVGMRERVALFGGELLAGATAAGGFLVRARMPLESA